MNVRLRLLRLDDWPAVHAWASREEACRFQVWGPNTEDETRTFVAEVVADAALDPPPRLAYAVEVDGEVLGNGTLTFRSRAQRQGEISYIVHPDAWGRGIATAAGRELLRIGFSEHGLHRIYATCDPRNLGSAAVLKKLGMTYEGRLRHTQYIRDGWRDSELFSLLEDEWTAGYRRERE